MQTWTMRMTAAQAAQSGEKGYYGLNRSAGGPATRVLQDSRGADVKARTRQEAREALGRAGHHFPEVDLRTHDFPDIATSEIHRVKVWVPGNQAVPVSDLANGRVAGSKTSHFAGWQIGSRPLLSVLIAGATGYLMAWLIHNQRR